MRKFLVTVLLAAAPAFAAEKTCATVTVTITKNDEFGDPERSLFLASQGRESTRSRPHTLPS